MNRPVRSPDQCTCSCHHKDVKIFCSCFGPCCDQPRTLHAPDKVVTCRRCKQQITSGEYAVHDRQCFEEQRDRPLQFFKRTRGATRWAIDETRRLTLWDADGEPVASFDCYEERFGQMDAREGTL